MVPDPTLTETDRVLDGVFAQTLLFGQGAGQIKLSQVALEQTVQECAQNLRTVKHGGGWQKGWSSGNGDSATVTITFDKPAIVTKLTGQTMYCKTGCRAEVLQKEDGNS